MTIRKRCVLAMAFCIAAVLRAIPAISAAGCASCVAPTYAVPAAVPTYTSYAVPSYAYMPTVVYRAMYRPVVATAYYAPVVYQPTAVCNPCTSYAVTTYRPAYAWAPQGRLVPYTTYRPVYAAMPVVAYSPCATCATYNPCSICSPCDTCSVVTSTVPATGCASCTAPAVTSPPSNGGGLPATNVAPQKTFQDAQKPSTETELKPIPQTPDAQPSSMPSPSLPDPRDRTAARSDYVRARVALTAASHAAPVQSFEGWQPARD